MKCVMKRVNGINITVDFRTELLAVIMLIGNYHKKYPHLFQNFDNNKDYVNKIIDYFSQYKNDEVVKDFDVIVEKYSFSYDAPFSLFLQLNEQLNIKQLDDYIFKTRLKSDINIYNFINKLNDFVKRTNFQKFYEDNKEMYRNWVNNISGVFKEYNIFNFFKKYYGYSIKKDFVINLIAFSTVGAYCCHLNDKIVCCYPVFEEMKKDKLYDSEGNEKSILTPLIHEFSHGFINPITERYNILNEKTNLFDDIRDCMKKQAYCYDSSIINEHIIRAVGARYIYLIYRDEIWYKKRIQKEKEAGFKYIDSVIDSLIYYEKHRKIYEKFDDFYPLIIENIKKYQHKE